MAFDLVFRKARLRSRKSLPEIGIEGGRIRRIVRSAGQRGRPVIDAGPSAATAVVSHGRLVDPAKLAGAERRR